MGRPLYSTLITPAEPVVRLAECEAQTSDRWSYVNADDPSFDPDSDDCFKGDVVYEAFLTPEEVVEREQERRTSEAQTEPQPSEDAQESTRAARLRFIESIGSMVAAHTATIEQNTQLWQPEWVEDDSASSESSASGRVSPADVILEHASQPEATREEMARQTVDEDHEECDIAPPSPVIPRHSISLPPSPPYPQARLLESLLATADLHEDLLTFPVRSAPIAIQRSPPNASAVMTPPGSVTPRFLHWSSRPRAIPMSPSPTPDAPLGSIRASRMAVSFVSPQRQTIGVEL